MSEDSATDEVQTHISSAVPAEPVERPGSGPTRMRILRATIKNFKAIEETTVPLSNFTVIVGTNGSGKSSILQYLHWALQSGRNIKVKPERAKGSTLSELDATYMPSPEYKNASHSVEYGNAAQASKMEIEIEAELDDGTRQSIAMWIKSAKNEGISVQIPSRNPLTTLIRTPRREVTAYIPGLAGIPLSEERRSKRIVQRQAAAGDANTVFRNILLLLKQRPEKEGGDGLPDVEALVCEVLGKTYLRVSFDEDADYKIKAEFQTAAMRDDDPKRYKPIELAGIGFLQVIQIFAYLVYFRPRFLLVDEPDSHLHPDVQERLTLTLMDAAKTYDSQVFLTTHSPSVVRALTDDASLVWMKKGEVASHNTDEIRRDMGWGLLDKTILLVTEDDKVGMLNKILSQWPDLYRKTAIWPTRGSSSLPPAESMSGLRQVFGDTIKITLHRDSDFMLEEDRKHYAKPYDGKSVGIWFTHASDIEAYWVDDAIVAAEFDISLTDARDLIHEAFNCLDEKNGGKRFNTKRTEVVKQIPAYAKGEEDHVGSADARIRLEAHGREFIHVGKELLGAIRSVATRKGLKGGHGLGKSIPEGMEVARDLKDLLQGL